MSSARSAESPAQQIKHPDLGRLSLGVGANVAVPSVRTRGFRYLDVRNQAIKGNEKICELTIRDGRVVWNLNGRAGEPYKP
jgi:dihydroorotase